MFECINMTEKVSLGDRSYQINWYQTNEEISSILKEKETQLREQGFIKQALITTDVIAGLYGEFLKNSFNDVTIITIKDGEASKTLEQAAELVNLLLEKGFTRKSVLYAFGGGVIGDLTGFTASIFMRGIPYIQIPTTLLAMVDSSVGGKTGVNTEKGKNLIGTFYQPLEVLINVGFLKTLEQRELHCGLAEVFKSAIIYSNKFYNYLEGQVPLMVNADPEVMKLVSHESVKIKAAVVAKDETEQSLRAILNYGHTLGHALEAWYEYKQINHGEAVAVGMAFATYLSYKKNKLDEHSWQRSYDLIGFLGLPKNFNDLPGRKKPSAKELIEIMKLDKKAVTNEIRFVLISSIGKAELPMAIAEDELLAHLEEFIKI